jgi:hypothetical protein
VDARTLWYEANRGVAAETVTALGAGRTASTSITLDVPFGRPGVVASYFPLQQQLEVQSFLISDVDVDQQPTPMVPSTPFSEAQANDLL